MADAIKQFKEEMNAILATKKDVQEQRKAQSAAYRKKKGDAKVNCPCGRKYLQSEVGMHNKSIKHINWQLAELNRKIKEAEDENAFLTETSDRNLEPDVKVEIGSGFECKQCGWKGDDAKKYRNHFICNRHKFAVYKI